MHIKTFISFALIQLLLAGALGANESMPTSVAANSSVYTTHDATFISKGVSLSATVVIPKHVTAAVAVVHGSGQRTRMTPLAKELAKQGLAVITYDKRGVGKSGGAYAGPEVGTNNVDPENLDLLASDAAAALEYLSSELSNSDVPIGFFGISQAGWVIPIAASKQPKAKFFILWSGPVVTTKEQLRFQFYTNDNQNFWDTHTETDVREHIRSDKDRFEMVDTDPRDILSKLNIPALWLFGGRDILAPVGLSIERLTALAAQGKPYAYQVFPGSGHFLKDDEAIPAMTTWLRQTFPQKNSGKNSYRENESST